MPDIIDQSVTFRLMKKRIAQTSNERHLKMLKQLLKHAEGEAAADLDSVMETLGANPAYHSFGGGAHMNPVGRDAVLKFYIEEVIGGGKHFFEYDLDRLVVDDDAIVTEGNFKALYWGHDAKRDGFPVDDPEAFYLLHVRMLIVWPYDEDANIIGEDSYTAITRPDFLQKIEDSQVPLAFREYLNRRLASAA
jgi:hypothetical protein